ncbi:MAG: hypothetical protein LBU70_10515, partial [Chitinispirillales bacterium]|nr:hypothetical protein [Chitinispirillales bacterium]
WAYYRGKNAKIKNKTTPSTCFDFSITPDRRVLRVRVLAYSVLEWGRYGGGAPVTKKKFDFKGFDFKDFEGFDFNVEINCRRVNNYRDKCGNNR